MGLPSPLIHAWRHSLVAMTQKNARNYLKRFLYVMNRLIDGGFHVRVFRIWKESSIVLVHFSQKDAVCTNKNNMLNDTNILWTRFRESFLRRNSGFGGYWSSGLTTWQTRYMYDDIHKWYLRTDACRRGIYDGYLWSSSRAGSRLCDMQMRRPSCGLVRAACGWEVSCPRYTVTLHTFTDTEPVFLSQRRGNVKKMIKENVRL